MIAVGGALFVLFGAFALLTGRPGTSSDPMLDVIMGSVIIGLGAVWLLITGRRWITVWGEMVDYQPFFARRRTIWAMDVVKVVNETNGTSARSPSTSTSPSRHRPAPSSRGTRAGRSSWRF